MDRLQTELTRLYRDPQPQPGRTRALLLEVLAPSGWRELSAAWRGVQADLDLPAPAISVSGRNALQLWFSLAEPVAEPQALALLEALRQRYLADTPAARVRAVAVDTQAGSDSPQAVPLPPHPVASDRWSVFVAHDLASLFDDERWLDQPADVAAQAELLCRLEAMKPEALAQAMAMLGAAPQAAPAPVATPLATHGAAPAGAPGLAAEPGPLTWQQDPRAFLLGVMNDPSVALALRIEAAKALLAKD